MGDVATVVKDKNNKRGYILDFFKSQEVTIKLVAVNEEAVATPPEHAVVNYRPYEFVVE